MTWLVPLPVVIPLAGAGLAVALGRRSQLQRTVSVLSLTAVLAASLTMLFTVDNGPLVVQVGDWPAPIGISLVADRLSALMLVISSAVTLCVLLFALAQDLALGDPDSPVAIFHPTYLVLTAGVAISFLAGDLFNLYVGFEVLLAASYVLITLGGTRARIRAGTIYVIMAIASSTIFLLAVALTYSATGTVNMAQLAGRLAEIDPGIRLTLQMLLLVAFAVKAAIFPLSAWLPDSYPTAPAPVTAVFAGLLTKVGIYAMLRIQTLLFGEGPADTILMWAALATMLVGILGAVAQSDLKRLLSFTLVSHIGLMVFGIALSSEAGLAGAIFYVLHHITVQTSLFLVAGLIERREGTTSLNRLGGLARSAPLLAALFLIPAFNLSGIPPLSGFLGKLGLLQAGVQASTPLAYVLVGGSLLTSLLTLYVFVKAWNKAFWQPAVEPTSATRLPAGMIGTASALVVLGFVLTLAAGPLFDYATEAARDLHARTPYIEAILGAVR
ncbi:MAG: Na+/H+ antiporter subunit D [Acidimicrobiales bacterium]|jgi:multicomponent Na+:H+ antiporter subunit D|nr:Na+/H+ antiporter subunit D [Acidimicrobiales bacterium]HLV90096.1 Na+/H+ antiporter subunit D [Acidimicrobiia bacterium]